MLKLRRLDAARIGVRDEVLAENSELFFLPTPSLPIHLVAEGDTCVFLHSIDRISKEPLDESRGKRDFNHRSGSNNDHFSLADMMDLLQ